MRYALFLIAITLLAAACGQSEELAVVAEPDVFELASVDSFSSTTAYTYSFAAGETVGDVGSTGSTARSPPSGKSPTERYTSSRTAPSSPEPDWVPSSPSINPSMM
jgi:hypothetical protein